MNQWVIYIYYKLSLLSCLINDHLIRMKIYLFVFLFNYDTYLHSEFAKLINK